MSEHSERIQEVIEHNVTHAVIHDLCVSIRYQEQMVQKKRESAADALDTLAHSFLTLIDNEHGVDAPLPAPVEERLGDTSVYFTLCYQQAGGERQMLDTHLHDEMYRVLHENDSQTRPQVSPQITHQEVFDQVACQVIEDKEHWKRRLRTEKLSPFEVFKGFTESTLSWICNQRPLPFPEPITFQWCFQLGEEEQLYTLQPDLMARFEAYLQEFTWLGMQAR